MVELEEILQIGTALNKTHSKLCWGARRIKVAEFTNTTTSRQLLKNPKRLRNANPGHKINGQSC